MKPKLLVVGDSFMLPDSEYIGRHWSEMLPEYDVLMYSRSGASNGIIAYNFFQGLAKEPDAVVIGFSAPDRIEFQVEQQANTDYFRWTTGSDANLNSLQKTAAEYYSMIVCQEMQFFKNVLLAKSLLLTLEKQKIPFAYTCNLLFNQINDLAGQHLVNQHLGEFEQHRCPTNLATYPNWKASPGFHTDDPEWQKRFAQEVREILQKPVDFCVKI